MKSTFKLESILVKFLLILGWLLIIEMVTLCFLLEYKVCKPIQARHWFVYPIGFFSFFAGLYGILGTIHRWKSFKNGYKRIDLEAIFGTTIGRLLYVLLGIFLCILAIILIFNPFNVIPDL
jgi:purine-cytosine permease-like protein